MSKQDGKTGQTGVGAPSCAGSAVIHKPCNLLQWTTRTNRVFWYLVVNGDERKEQNDDHSFGKRLHPRQDLPL